MSKLCPRYMSQICPKYISKYVQDNVPDMSQLCLRFSPDMSQICPRDVPDISQLCPSYALDMTKICPKYVFRYVPDLSLIFSKKFTCMSHIYLRYVIAGQPNNV